jgi:hypothetical protein
LGSPTVFITFAHKSGPYTLLPDGRFSGQITQNRPEKNISGGEKLVAVRPPIFLKNG